METLFKFSSLHGAMCNNMHTLYAHAKYIVIILYRPHCSRLDIIFKLKVHRKYTSPVDAISFSPMCVGALRIPCTHFSIPSFLCLHEVLRLCLHFVCKIMNGEFSEICMEIVVVNTLSIRPFLYISKISDDITHSYIFFTNFWSWF